MENQINNFLVGENGDFVLAYRLLLPEKYSLGESDFDMLNTIFSKALKDLPDKSVFLKTDVFKKKKIDTSDFAERNFLEQERKEYFKNYDYVEHETYAFFILPNKTILNKHLKNPFRSPNADVFKAFDDKINSYINEVTNVINYITSVKLSDSSQLKFEALENDFLRQYYSYYMSGFQSKFNVDIRKNWSNLQIGTRYASVLRMPNEKDLPDDFNTFINDDEFSSNQTKFFKGYGDNFSYALKFDHIYNQIAFIDEHKKHMNTAKKNYNKMLSSSSIDVENKKLAEQSKIMLEELADNIDQERLIRSHINVVVLADSEKELEDNIEEVVTAFNSFDVKVNRLFGDNLLAVYEYSYPLNCSYFIENHLFVCSNKLFSAFLILTGSYQNDKNGVYFNSRLNNLPVKVDVWDEDKKYIKARNAMMLAPTGEGKSVLANHVITDAFVNGERQVIIDLGGSYEKISALFKEDTAYITYREGESLGLNPFQIIPSLDLDDKGNVTTDKIQDITDFVGVHYKRMDSLNDLEMASIRKIVELYYTFFNQIDFIHSFHHFIKFVEQHHKKFYAELEIEDSFLPSKEFIFLLKEFGESGVYGNLYSNADNAILDELDKKKIIIFELDKIKGNQLLLIVMLQLIGSTIQKVVWSDKTTRGRVWFDEVAEVLQWGGMLRRLQWYYQAIRKQEGAITIILQSVAQFPNNELSSSIIDNTKILYVLTSDNYKPIQDRFNLSQHAFYQMSSLQSDFNSKRKYSEIFIRRGKKTGVYRLELPLKTFWAYQTEGKKNAQLMKLYYDNPDAGMLGAINQFLEENKN